MHVTLTSTGREAGKVLPEAHQALEPGAAHPEPSRFTGTVPTCRAWLYLEDAGLEVALAA